MGVEPPPAQKPLLFTHEGRLYDVSGFADRHPGGRKVLERVSGGDLAPFMAGQQRILGVKHAHSEAAYTILKRYAVDHKIRADEMIDETTPMVGRVGQLGDRYWTWIHQPYEGSLRLFQSDFLERLTRTAWWVIPAVWMPLVALFAVRGLHAFCAEHGLWRGCWLSALLFLLGTLAWTLLEYSLHRGVFHWVPDPRSPRQITLHFLMHGLHHKTPMDGDRLVFPPAAALLIVAVFYTLYAQLLPFNVFCCFCSGKLFGYVCYDLVHYYLHHGRPAPSSGMHFRKVYHHNHHFKDYDLGFGISTSLWDHVFDTVGTGPL